MFDGIVTFPNAQDADLLPVRLHHDRQRDRVRPHLGHHSGAELHVQPPGHQHQFVPVLGPGSIAQWQAGHALMFVVPRYLRRERPPDHTPADPLPVRPRDRCRADRLPAELQHQQGPAAPRFYSIDLILRLQNGRYILTTP